MVYHEDNLRGLRKSASRAFNWGSNCRGLCMSVVGNMFPSHEKLDEELQVIQQWLLMTMYTYDWCSRDFIHFVLS